MGKQAPRAGAISFYDELKAEHADPSTVAKQCVRAGRFAVRRAPADAWRRRAAETAERPGGLVPIFLAIQGSSLKPPGPDIREVRRTLREREAARADAATALARRRAFCGG